MSPVLVLQQAGRGAVGDLHAALRLLARVAGHPPGADRHEGGGGRVLAVTLSWRYHDIMFGTSVFSKMHVQCPADVAM